MDKPPWIIAWQIGNQIPTIYTSGNSRADQNSGAPWNLPRNAAPLAPENGKTLADGPSVGHEPPILSQKINCTPYLGSQVPRREIEVTEEEEEDDYEPTRTQQGTSIRQKRMEEVPRRCSLHDAAKKSAAERRRDRKTRARLLNAVETSPQTKFTPRKIAKSTRGELPS